MSDQCNACPEQGIVYTAGRWWCPEHLHLGVVSALTEVGWIEEPDEAQR